MPTPRSGVDFLITQPLMGQKPPQQTQQTQDSLGRHAITWVLVGALLAIVGAFLALYALPLMDKAYDIADEALELTAESKVKLAEFDRDKDIFLDRGLQKLEEVGAATVAVNGFLNDGTRAVEEVGVATKNAKLFLNNATQAVAAVLVLAERMNATLTRVDAVLTSLEQTNAALQPPPPPSL